MKIVEAKPQGQFQVFLRLDDGIAGTVDLSDNAGRGVFRAWDQPGVFQQLFISPFGALAWPGDIDLCPDALYMQMTGKSLAEFFPADHCLSTGADLPQTSVILNAASPRAQSKDLPAGGSQT